MAFTFSHNSADTSCTPSFGAQGALEISNTTFGPSTINTGSYRVSSIADIFNKIRDENVCVIKDSSLRKTTWKLFWNQDAVIFALNNFKKSITDTKICPEREYLL